MAWLRGSGVWSLPAMPQVEPPSPNSSPKPVSLANLHRRRDLCCLANPLQTSSGSTGCLGCEVDLLRVSRGLIGPLGWPFMTVRMQLATPLSRHNLYSIWVSIGMRKGMFLCYNFHSWPTMGGTSRWPTHEQNLRASTRITCVIWHNTWEGWPFGYTQPKKQWEATHTS